MRDVVDGLFNIVVATILVASVGVKSLFHDCKILRTALGPNSMAHVASQLTWNAKKRGNISIQHWSCVLVIQCKQ